LFNFYSFKTDILLDKDINFGLRDVSLTKGLEVEVIIENLERLDLIIDKIYFL